MRLNQLVRFYGTLGGGYQWRSAQSRSTGTGSFNDMVAGCSTDSPTKLKVQFCRVLLGVIRRRFQRVGHVCTTFE